MNAAEYLSKEMSEGRVTLDHLVRLTRAYQARVGLVPDGKLGPKTREVLDDEPEHTPVEQTTPAMGRPTGSAPGLAPPETISASLPNLDLPPAQWVEGIDVSRFQPTLDWAQVGTSGVRFVYVKATEGQTYTDPTFRDKWTELGPTTLLRGAYHFLRPDNNEPKAEAEHFAKVLGELNPGDLPPVGDLEVSRPKRSPAELAAWVNEWCTLVRRLTLRQPIIYTYTAYWIDQLGRTDTLRQWPLWLADYRLPSPDRPISGLGGWQWLLWQWTGEGSVPGHSGKIDRNVFRGDLRQLQALANLKSAEAPTPAPSLPPSAPTPALEGTSNAPLRVRALQWCLDEAARWGSSRVAPERVREYFSGCVRDGKKLGLSSGNFCAAAQGFAEAQVKAQGEPLPPWRAAAREPMYDAKAGLRGSWHPAAEVRSGHYLPPPGALAVYWRGSPTDWRGHIERVVETSGDAFRSVGANESAGFGNGGRWVVETTPYAHPQLLGFVVDDEPAPKSDLLSPPLHFVEI